MLPKIQKQVRALISLVNYYRYMWSKQSHLIHNLTVLTSNKIKFKWSDAEQKVFNEIKRIVACNTLLIYLDSNKRFYIHTDASDF